MTPPLKDLILVGGPKERISPVFLLCPLQVAVNINQKQVLLFMSRDLCVLMNTVFSLNANKSCFYLLLTPSIPTSYLIRINAICEVKLLLTANDHLLFLKITLGVVH